MIRLFARSMVLVWPKTALWTNFPSKRGAILDCLPRFLFWSRPRVFLIFRRCSRASFSAVCGPISPRFRARGVPCSSASLWTTFLGLCVLFGPEFCGLRRVVCTFRFCGLAATLALPDAWVLALRPRMGFVADIMDVQTISMQIQEMKADHEAGVYPGQEGLKAELRAVATEEVLGDPNLCMFNWLRVCAKLLGRASGQWSRAFRGGPSTGAVPAPVQRGPGGPPSPRATVSTAGGGHPPGQR